jgi:HK97 family phage prohead protease
MKRYAKMIEDLRAKNFKQERIKELVLNKAKTEIQNFQMPFKSFNVKADEGAEAGKVIEIEGYASTKDEDRYGDIVNPSAFEESINNFMANPVMLLQHDHNKRIGDFTSLSIDDNGLYVKGDVKYTAGDPELFEKIENKSLRGFSIGFRVLEAEFEDKTDEKGNVVDFVFIIKKLDLIEISVVNVPANPFTLMKSLADLTTKSFEAVIKDAEEEEEKEEDLEGLNENENNDDNSNDNQEEEKEIKTEITDDKVDNEEADNDGEEEADDVPEEKNLDEEEEKDIVKEEEENLENPNEKKDVEKNEEDSKSFTTKMVEQIVEAKMS